MRQGIIRACQIADIDRDRFNEAVAKGHYTCAPKVRAGMARSFTETDLIALTIYGQLLKLQYPPRLAGPLVADIHKHLCEEPFADGIWISRGPITYEFNIFRIRQLIRQR